MDRASQQKWYMITYTLTKEIVDNETILNLEDTIMVNY